MCALPVIRAATRDASATRVSVVLVRALFDAVESYGIARADLAGVDGFALEQIERADARIELAVFRDLHLRAIALTGDHALGLHFGERASETAFDFLGHLISHAPTLRAALGLCSQFQSLFMDGTRMQFDEHAGTALWRLDFVRSDPQFDAFWSEFAIVGMQRALQLFCGRHVRADAVYVEYRRPPHHAEYTRVFGSAVRFGQAFTGIDFAAGLLDQPHLYRNSELHAMLLSQAERALDRLGQPASYRERLRYYFLARSPARIPSIATAARELGLSERSLRRKLTAEGASYRALVQAALEEAACTMLRNPRCTIQEVAHALGFADVTAFHRAFKRWLGVTPQDYRSRHFSDIASRSGSGQK
jgi:AraC-like DNA-binding protein